MYHSIIKCYFRDSINSGSHYEAISVIEFNNTLQASGESQGHYMYICDIKDKSSNLWYRTNDNCVQIPIRLQDVSTFGYVVMYKRKSA